MLEWNDPWLYVNNLIFLNESYLKTKFDPLLEVNESTPLENIWIMHNKSRIKWTRTKGWTKG